MATKAAERAAAVLHGMAYGKRWDVESIALAVDRETGLQELLGTVNVLADKLARYTGRTVPQEIRDATAEARRGDNA